MKLSNIMTRDVKTISPDATVKEAARMLFNLGISGLPVMDASGKIVGVITEKDIIALALPKYLESMGLNDFAYILDEDPFDKNIAEFDKVLVKSIMKKDVVCASSDTSVPEAARLMLAKQLRRLPVIENGRLAGIVARADIVREIAKRTGLY